MCGIAGFWTPRPLPDAAAVVAAMAERLAHRGPDGAGHWCDDARGFAMAHRRLAILDLSPTGRQPMASSAGRYVIAFNGEIYNHLDMRAELTAAGLAPAWRGHSDTESLLAAVEAWGIDTALRKTAGMFAFALWDRLDNKLHLARDRFGEKPLYYGWQRGCLLFGSELKALKVHPSWDGKLDRDAATLYMRYAYVPAPWSIYAGIYKLPPGTRLEIAAPTPPGSIPDPLTYWSMAEAARAGSTRLIDDETAATEELERLLKRAVQRQMMADVPLGAFLSGGIDSSTVVALMQATADRPVKTFSIGFRDDRYNEAEHAKRIACHLGTDHTELYVAPEEALSVIPSLPTLYDEPFADSSQIPTHLVSRLAREKVTVSLSGDGGDELFGGYNHYFWARSVRRWTGFLPSSARRGIGRLALALSPEAWDRAFGIAGHLLPRRLRFGMVGDKVYKLGSLLATSTPDELYRRLISHWPEPQRLVAGGREPTIWAVDQVNGISLEGFVDRMMLSDQLCYLTDDILTKVDRASMAVSLETRVPLLDPEVAEFSWRLPLAMKIRDGRGKWLLREVLHRYVPRALFERPKMGFSVPLDMWLRGPLREWAESLLEGSKLRNEGYLDPILVRRCWMEHVGGHRNWQYRLWNILMFQAWLNDAGQAARQ